MGKPRALIRKVTDARQDPPSVPLLDGRRARRIQRALESVTTKHGANQHTTKEDRTGVRSTKTQKQAAEEAGVSDRTLQRRAKKAGAPKTDKAREQLKGLREETQICVS